MRFYLGTANAAWLARTEVPLFVSHRTLRGRKSHHRALGPWALDSGAFSELSAFGEWRMTPAEYIRAVNVYADRIGRLQWAAPMDWMCEPHIVEKTGLSVREHQARTIDNYLKLACHGPFIPVLQGWEVDDYLDHAEQYAAAGVNLYGPLVGIGSVCRRAGTQEAIRTVSLLAGAGIKLHGFGLKTTAVKVLAPFLASSDSMAWSYRARRGDVQLPGCTHKRCTNCLPWALEWRDHVLGSRADSAQGVML